MDISVIIVNYNTKHLLPACLNSIKEQTHGVTYEIIVVDNASHDGSLEMLATEYTWVKVIESDINLGFGRANNLGMKNASGKYFFLLNSDTILLNNALKYFFDFAESHNDIGSLGSILLGINQQPCHSYGRFITPSNELKFVIAKYFRFLKDKTLLNPPLIDKPMKVEYITGADLFVPQSVYAKLGGFDPDFFMYCEEVDWQQRMANVGLKRIIIPGPQIIHLEGGSDTTNHKSSTWSPSRLKNIYTSHKIYQKKHFSKRMYPFFRFAYILLRLPSIVISIFVKNGNHRN